MVSPPVDTTAPSPDEADLVAVIGPTATGKTGVVLHASASVPIEVLACDSMTVYRGLNIGTSKPTAEEQRTARHHLIDVCDPHEEMDAGAWSRAAEEIAASIRQRGSQPVVVGGTGFYLRALEYGLVDVPNIPSDVQAELRRRLAEEGARALYVELQRVDPDLAESLHPTNGQRIVRGLAVYLGSGQRLSELQRAHQFKTRRNRIKKFALDWPRAELYARVDARAKAMVDEGLVAEVEGLLASGVSKAARALQAPGYVQALAVLSGEMTVAEMVDAMAQSHRRYAKRQLTWFRRDPSVEWLPGAERKRAADAVGAFLSRMPAPAG